jgi:CPA1 family monovalent cation:H+ antiporter
LVVAGLFFGFLPFVLDVTLGPEVLLIGVLPLLVYQTAFVSSPGALYQNAGPIGLLAVGLVLVTAGVTAVVGRGVAHLRWQMAFVLGTAVRTPIPLLRRASAVASASHHGSSRSLKARDCSTTGSPGAVCHRGGCGRDAGNVANPDLKTRTRPRL